LLDPPDTARPAAGTAYQRPRIGGVQVVLAGGLT